MHVRKVHGSLVEEPGKRLGNCPLQMQFHLLPLMILADIRAERSVDGNRQGLLQAGFGGKKSHSL